MFECHILSFVEGATYAIYHVASLYSQKLDETFNTFLEFMGVSAEVALLSNEAVAPTVMH